MTTPIKELFDERNSLLFWYPKIPPDIPMPITKWVEFPTEVGRGLLEPTAESIEAFEPFLQQIKTIAKEIGYPVFIRTDMASGKHDWENCALVIKEKDLLSHIIATIEFNEMVGVVGLNYKAIVVRAFLELDWRFKAFHGNLPISRERRYFVRDGKVLCRHPYWCYSAIQQAHKDDGKKLLNTYLPHRLPYKWQEMLADLNTETEDEIKLLTSYAEKVAGVISGFWSVDFACSREGTWCLIDMALGEASEHPKHQINEH